ncbi:MAG TPA: sigma-70 family RNA polymerase sigma factor, partial [Ktedonobacterales bacterium]
DEFSRALVAERPRLVRLCHQLTGSADVAEDLAQETLLEAWRLLDRLQKPEGVGAWLSAIARNICHRWARAHGRERLHLTPLVSAQDGDGVNDEVTHALLLAEMDDPVADVERAELTALLGRALAPLPQATRALMLASVVAETSTADLAQRFGLSEGAVRVRLHRGRQALRLALSGDLRAEAESLELTLPATPMWRESRIWCPFCGASHLRYRIDRESGAYNFHCAGACGGMAVVGSAVNSELLAQVSSPKSLVTRHCLYLATSYRAALAGATERCSCGASATYFAWTPDTAPRDVPYGIFGVCPNCGTLDASTAWHLTLDTTEAQRFWRRHPRMRALPMQRIERDNRVAIVTGFASADGEARLEIVSDAASYALLHASASDAR